MASEDVTVHLNALSSALSGETTTNTEAGLNPSTAAQSTTSGTTPTVNTGGIPGSNGETMSGRSCEELCQWLLQAGATEETTDAVTLHGVTGDDLVFCFDTKAQQEEAIKQVEARLGLSGNVLLCMRLRATATKGQQHLAAQQEM